MARANPLPRAVRWGRSRGELGLLGISLVLIGIAASLTAAQARSGAGPAITAYRLPHPGDPQRITAGPDGALWFAESSGPQIGAIALDGTVREFALPDRAADPTGLAAGPDGALWFTERAGNRIGRVSMDGQVTTFDVPTPQSAPASIVAGADGNLWFTEATAGQIGRITPEGQVREFPIGPGITNVGSITAGADGKLWVLLPPAGIVCWTPAGGGAIFALPAAYTAHSLTAGPDGDLWVTEAAASGAGAISQVSLAGRVYVWSLPAAWGQPGSITLAADGNLWFTTSGDYVAAIHSDGHLGLPIALPPGSGLAGVAAGADGNLWVTEATAGAIARLIVPEPP